MDFNKLKELPVEEFNEKVEQLIVSSKGMDFLIEFVNEQSEDIYDEVVYLIEKLDLDMTVEEYEATKGAERSNLFTDSTSDFYGLYYDMLMNFVEEFITPKEIEIVDDGEETLQYYIQVDYEEFKPSTYKGVVILSGAENNKEVFRSNTDDYEHDYLTALLYFNESLSGKRNLYRLSSVDNYTMDKSK